VISIDSSRFSIQGTVLIAIAKNRRERIEYNIIRSTSSTEGLFKCILTRELVSSGDAVEILTYPLADWNPSRGSIWNLKGGDCPATDQSIKGTEISIGPPILASDKGS
jgi:hypothetical protein